jgi:hypothetical protein
VGQALASEVVSAVCRSSGLKRRNPGAVIRSPGTEVVTMHARSSPCRRRRSGACIGFGGCNAGLVLRNVGTFGWNGERPAALLTGVVGAHHVTDGAANLIRMALDGRRAILEPRAASS